MPGPSASASTRPRSTARSARWSAKSSGCQGDGDYAGTKAFLDKYGHSDAEAEQVIATMTHIPVDIRPVYPERI